MKYLSVCSGIEAATCAWHGLGWEPVAFSEIEKFPSAVLAHHHPNVPNLGDMTKYKEWEINEPVDLLVGGTPCQSFSVAGLRKGLDDPRGNLMLTFLGIADRLRSEWLVWENVPGVLSSWTGPNPPGDVDLERGWEATEESDLSCFLAGLTELGYGWAYRILDAQYFGVPQRRRRVFVVGCLGDWQRAGKVLFERESLRGDSPPSRKARESTAADVAPSIGASGRGFARAGESRGQDPVIACFGGNNQSGPIDVATARNAHGGPHGRLDFESETFCIQAGAAKENPNHGPDGVGVRSDGQAYTIEARAEVQIVAHSLRGEGFDASEDGTGRGTPLVCHGTQDPCVGDIAFTLGKNNGGENAIAFAQNQAGDVLTGDVSACLGTNQNATGRNTGKVQRGMQVRRLTPVECERLQGFPDNWTAIPWRGKPADQCPDGPRYRAIGNSMAVPVMRWIGERIDAQSKP